MSSIMPPTTGGHPSPWSFATRQPPGKPSSASKIALSWEQLLSGHARYHLPSLALAFSICSYRLWAIQNQPSLRAWPPGRIQRRAHSRSGVAQRRGVTASGRSGSSLQGVVCGDAVDAASQTIELKAQFNKKYESLIPGMSGIVKF